MTLRHSPMDSPLWSRDTTTDGIQNNESPIKARIPSLILMESSLPFLYFSMATGIISSGMPWNRYQNWSPVSLGGWGFIEADGPVTCVNPSWSDAVGDIKSICNLAQSLLIPAFFSHSSLDAYIYGSKFLQERNGHLLVQFYTRWYKSHHLLKNDWALVST